MVLKERGHNVPDLTTETGPVRRALSLGQLVIRPLSTSIQVDSLQRRTSFDSDLRFTRSGLVAPTTLELSAGSGSSLSLSTIKQPALSLLPATIRLAQLRHFRPWRLKKATGRLCLGKSLSSNIYQSYSQLLCVLVVLSEFADRDSDELSCSNFSLWCSRKCLAITHCHLQKGTLLARELEN